MAGEVQAFAISGCALYYVALNEATGQAVKSTALETLTAANWADYALALPESDVPGIYVGALPVVIAGIYSYTVYRQVGGSPATADPCVGYGGPIQWNGSAVVPYLSSAQAQSAAEAALTAYDPPTNAEMEARTLVAADYFDPATDEVSADLKKISGDSTAADRLEAMLDATLSGAVVDDADPHPTAWVFKTNLTQGNNDFFNDGFVQFYSGALQGQSRKIVDYDGSSKVIIVSRPFTTAPTGDDTFMILGRSE